MENRKGSGIFLGIVSVATLIVAIIGATFAFFSAQTESADDAVNLQAYEFKLLMDVERIYPIEGQSAKLIPMAPDTVIDGATAPNNTNLLYALNSVPGTEEEPKLNRCIDAHNLQVCALYQVTIYNSAENAVTMTGVLEEMSNVASTETDRTQFTNLRYQALTGNHATDTLAKKPDSTAQTLHGGAVTLEEITVEAATTGDDGEVIPGTGTAYILVYLNEAGAQSGEMGAQWTGKVTYTSKDDEANKLTALFKVS